MVWYSLPRPLPLSPLFTTPCNWPLLFILIIFIIILRKDKYMMRCGHWGTYNFSNVHHWRVWRHHFWLNKSPKETGSSGLYHIITCISVKFENEPGPQRPSQQNEFTPDYLKLQCFRKPMLKSRLYLYQAYGTQASVSLDIHQCQ